LLLLRSSRVPRSLPSRATSTRDELSWGGDIEREFYGQCE
jgi:hypothetical protein